jgi:hypothetical protein
VEAFPNPDGTGVVQAIGATTVAIISGVTTQATIDPASTVDHLDLTPQPLIIIPNRSAPLLVAPRNSANALVLVAPSSLAWTSSSPDIASVDASGVVTGIKLGDTSVRVTDTESGQSTTAPVHVVPPIVIDPPQATVSIGDHIAFTATVTGLPSSAVTWQVQESETGGTIDPTGHYAAPGGSGTFHVIATSVSDPTISATATIVVQAGSGTVIIR